MKTGWRSLRNIDRIWSRVGSGAVLFILAALLRPFGVAVVLPLIIAASVVWVDAAVPRTGPDASLLRRATFGAFAIRWISAIVLYCASLYHWPIARSLQAGGGFWLFCMDALRYHAWAPQMADAVAWELPLPNPAAGATIDYYLVVAGIYALYGTSPLTAIAINILAWTLGTVFLVVLFTSLRGQPVSPSLILILSFWPSGLIWPTQLMKDSLVVLFFIIAALAAVRLIRSRILWSGIAAGALLWAALMPLLRLRPYLGRVFFASALIAVLAGLLFWLAGRRDTWRSATLAAILAVLSFCGVLFIGAPDSFFILAPAEPAQAYLRYGWAMEERGNIDAARSAYERALVEEPDLTEARLSVVRLTGRAATGTSITSEDASRLPSVRWTGTSPLTRLGRILGRLSITTREAAGRLLAESINSFAAMAPRRLGAMRHKFVETGGASEFGTSRQLNGWQDAIRMAPSAFAAGLFAPYPWDVIRPRGITGHFRTIAVSESLLMMGLLPAILLGVSRLRRLEELFVVTLAVSGVLALSLIVTNVGTLFRLREVFVLFVVALAAYGMDAYALLVGRVPLLSGIESPSARAAVGVMRPTANERFVLVDAGQTRVPAGRCVAFWSRVDVPEGCVSVPLGVEANAADLGREYVAWTHDVGAFVVGGRSIRAHLAFWPEFSFWWLGLIPEKAPLRSSTVYTVFKLRTLERIYIERDCRGLLYMGRDRTLHRILRNWCRELRHPYAQVRGDRTPTEPRAGTRVVKTLPHLVQALGYVALKWWSRYRLVARSRAQPHSGQTPAATVITFFPNVDLESTRQGRFRSRYWEQLHDVLDELPVTIRWIWLYVDSKQVSFRQTIRLRDVCNAAQAGKYQHILLDEYATPRVIARALRVYSKSCLAGWQLGAARDAFHMPNSALNFFPALAYDWGSSFAGIAAMDGAILSALFDEAARRLGSSIWTLYVWENQPWELAALAAWRRHENGRIVGVQHATLPPLDLRAFADPRELAAPNGERRPIPDLLAVNGSGARDLMIESGFPSSHLVLTEALRYSHLKRSIHSRPHPTRTLLIATGFRRSEAAFQLTLVATAAERGALAGYSRVLIKPHPFCPIDTLLEQSMLPLDFEIEHAPLSALWSQVDVAFVGNSTSTAAEGLYLQIPTAVCGPADEMNLSPAFGRDGVVMVSTSAQLEAFLREPHSAPWPTDYLAIDEALPRWRRLLTV